MWSYLKQQKKAQWQERKSNHFSFSLTMISALIIPYLIKKLSSSLIQVDFRSKCIDNYGIRDNDYTTVNVLNTIQLYTLKCLISCEFYLSEKYIEEF